MSYSYLHKFDKPKINADCGFYVSFSAKAQVCSPVEVSVCCENEKNVTMRYFVPVQNTRICLLITGDIPKSIELVSDYQIELRDICLEECHEADAEKASLKTGMFLLEDFEKITLDENGGIGIGPCCDMVLHENLLFTIGGGRLTCVDIEDIENPQILSYLAINAPLRQIALHPDGKHVVITCRQNGMCIVDVTNPKNMVLRTKYDTVELATGIVTEGDYAFVSCRQFGVEIIDISDVNNPRHVGIARCGEAQSCKIHNGILYAGVWGGCRVDIIDVRNPANPVHLSKAILNGKGDGLSVCTFDGKTYLYAATGQHSQNVPVETAFNDPRYGQGNGLDIFDVTDPTKPIWQSTTKIDGRFYCPANDYWEAEISKAPDGRIYAYFVNSHNGVYALDVTDPKAVKRLMNIDIVVPKTSPRYRVWTHPVHAVLYPYNQREFTKDVTGAVICLDGYMLIAGVTTDLHIYRNDALIFRNLETSYNGFEEKGSFYEEKPEDIVASYSSAGQVYAVCRKNNELFAACGQKGIACLDAVTLEQKYVIPTQGVCMDCCVYEDTLFSAECEGGMGIYEIKNDTLIEKDRYISEYGVIKSIKLSPKAKYAVIQSNTQMCLVLRLSDKEVVHAVKTTAIMYFKNLCRSLVDGRYMGACGYHCETYWFDFGKEDELDIPILLTNSDKNMTFLISLVSMAGGYDACDKYAVGICGNGEYVIYNPSKPCSSYENMKPLIRKANTCFDGKPSICKDKIVITDRIEGRIYIGHISDDLQITVDKKICVKGNPDVALIKDNSLYVPLGYEGLVRIVL